MRNLTSETGDTAAGRCTLSVTAAGNTAEALPWTWVMGRKTQVLQRLPPPPQLPTPPTRVQSSTRTLYYVNKLHAKLKNLKFILFFIKKTTWDWWAKLRLKFSSNKTLTHPLFKLLFICFYFVHILIIIACTLRFLLLLCSLIVHFPLVRGFWIEVFV